MDLRAWKPVRLPILATLLLVAAGSCSRYYAAAPGAAPQPEGEPLAVIYLIGDFGRPEAPFRDLVAALGRDAQRLESLDLRTGPMILELGDNLYEEGLPHDLSAPGATAEVDKLRAIGTAFATIRYSGGQIPLVLIPGNHDYNNDALTNESNFGDISRWYFLNELGVEGAAAWRHLPGDASPFADAAALYAHLAGDPAAHAAFMAPVPVPLLDDEVQIFAIDSELLLDLYDQGHEQLAEDYWSALDAQLAAAPAVDWRFVAAHHPPVTYGKHGEPALGNWVFGQGWPQFPSVWHKALAVAVPLGIVAGVIVHPAALVIAAATPVSTALVTGRKQDVGSEPYDRYAAELLRLAAEHDLDGVLAGHDHNTQLIELGAVPGFEGESLLVITGAGSKVDPVRRGPGTVAFLSDYSFVRVTQYAAGLVFEIVDRHGEVRYRHDLPR